MSDYDPNYIPIYSQFLLSVKTIVYNDNDEILLLRRSEKSSRPHGWDFPGGGVDSGENPSDSVEREAFEETGVTVDNVQI